MEGKSINVDKGNNIMTQKQIKTNLKMIHNYALDVITKEFPVEPRNHVEDDELRIKEELKSFIAWFYQVCGHDGKELDMVSHALSLVIPLNIDTEMLYFFAMSISSLVDPDTFDSEREYIRYDKKDIEGTQA